MSSSRVARRSVFVFIAALGVASVSCGGGGSDGPTGPGGGGGPTPAPVATVDVAPSPASVVVGGTSQLNATVKDASGNVLTGRTLTWTSDNDPIASVSSSGLVTGKSIGSAKVTATVEGKTATVTVDVTPVPVASVSVTPATSSLVVGGKVQLSATTKDAAGNTLTGRTVTWSTSDANVASVNASTGEVTAVAVGNATITATSEGKTATAQITVAVAPVATVVVNPSSVSVLPGNKTQLSAVTSDASGHVLTGRTVTWSSSDNSKATVDASGLVTGVAYGKVTITATSEGKQGTAAVTVSDGSAPTLVSLSVTPSSIDVTSGDKVVTITGHVTDAGGSGVAQFAVTASAPDGPFATCIASTPASGDRTSGDWSCSMTLPIGADPGTWKLLVLVSDAGFSARSYTNVDLAAAGQPSSFAVVSNTPDKTPPVFASYTVSPTTVSVANGAQTVTVSAHLTDNMSGTATLDFTAISPTGRQIPCSAAAPVSGTRLDGQWTCSITIPADAEAGTWTLSVRATDRAFWYQAYGPQPDGTNPAFPAGFTSSITVTR